MCRRSPVRVSTSHSIDGSHSKARCKEHCMNVMPSKQDDFMEKPRARDNANPSQVRTTEGEQDTLARKDKYNSQKPPLPIRDDSVKKKNAAPTTNSTRLNIFNTEPAVAPPWQGELEEKEIQTQERRVGFINSDSNKSQDLKFWIRGQSDNPSHHKAKFERQRNFLRTFFSRTSKQPCTSNPNKPELANDGTSFSSVTNSSDGNWTRDSRQLQSSASILTLRGVEVRKKVVSLSSTAAYNTFYEDTYNHYIRG